MFCIQGDEAAGNHAAAAPFLQKRMVKLFFFGHTDNVQLH